MRISESGEKCRAILQAQFNAHRHPLVEPISDAHSDSHSQVSPVRERVKVIWALKFVGAWTEVSPPAY